MELTINKREILKKSETKKLRNSGYIPANLYSSEGENKNVFVSKAEMEKILRNHPKGRLSSLVFNLKIDGKKQKAILKDIQYHSTSYDIIHMDFLLVSEKGKVTVNVPIECIGINECQGIKLGGTLRQVFRSLKVRCLIKDLPEVFEVNVKDLGVMDSKKLKDLSIPAGVTPLQKMEQVAVIIAKH